MKYKVGDRVRIKSIDWYNENKDRYGTIYTSNGFCFCDDMTKHCGDIMKIIDIIVDPKDSSQGYYIMDNVKKWTDEMIECKVEEETKPKFKVGDILFYRGETCGYLKVEEIRVENGEIRYYETSRNIYLIENDPDVFADKVCSVETEETKPNTIEEAKTFWDSIKDAWICPDGYIFKDENGNVINATKIVLEKKKKEYPKTFDKCCHIVQTAFVCDVRLHKGKYYDIFRALAKLIVCRDAYYKIAGEEMGLGKPWEPDYDSLKTKYTIVVVENKVVKLHTLSQNHILTFPIEAMRDVFYENFKELIEQCKELL